MIKEEVENERDNNLKKIFIYAAIIIVVALLIYFFMKLSSDSDVEANSGIMSEKEFLESGGDSSLLVNEENLEGTNIILDREGDN